MSWTVGILAFVLYFPVLIVVAALMHIQNKKIEAEYKEKLEQIKQKYGAKE